MNIVFFVLSIYKNVFYVKASEYISSFPKMTYGYKKNTEVSLNISKITTQFVFGLAKKKEMKNINQLGSFFQYCDSHEKLSQIQFLIQNDTNLNFKIQEKNILTPFLISCDQLYKFELELEIKNGKNHLDYRCQNAMLFIYIFIFTLIGFFILLLLYFIIFRRKDFKSFATILVFILVSIIQKIPLYFEFLKSKNVEFIMVNKRYENIYISISSIILIYLCLYININDTIYYLYHKFYIFWNWFVLIIINIVLIIIILIINITTLNFFCLFFFISFIYIYCSSISKRYFIYKIWNYDLHLFLLFHIWSEALHILIFKKYLLNRISFDISYLY